MNAACLENLPLVFLIEDNGYAISVPVEKQTAGGNIAQLLAGFPNLKRLEVDGTDVVASYRRTGGGSGVRARAQRSGAGARHGDPALLAFAFRRRASYKTKAERDAEEARDPVLRFPEWLVSEGVLDRQALQVIVHEVDQEIQKATDHALARRSACKGFRARSICIPTRSIRPRPSSKPSRSLAASREPWWTRSI